MVRLLTRLGIPLLVLPLAAVAAPISVTTRSHGLIDPNPGAVYHLGMDLYDVRDGPVPYSLAISTRFDPDEFGLSEGGRSYWTPTVELALTLDIGTERYRYDGTVSTSMSLRVLGTGSGYEQTIGLIPAGPPRFVTFITNSLDGPVGSGGPWAPRELSVGVGQGSTRIYTFLDDPEAPSLSWEMRADADAMSLQVSAVPEPAPAYALLAGLGAMCFLGRRRPIKQVRSQR